MPSFKNLISKVVVNTNNNSKLAKDILDWGADVKPIVIVESQRKGADK